MLSKLWLDVGIPFFRAEKPYMPKAGWIFLLRMSNLPLAYHLVMDSARRAEKKSHGQKNKPPVCCG